MPDFAARKEWLGQHGGEFYLLDLEVCEVKERGFRWYPRGGGLLPLGCRGKAGSRAVGESRDLT